MHISYDYSGRFSQIGGSIVTYNDIGRIATNKYRSKFDLIQIRVQQGERERISEHAAKHGESMNAFINRAIEETIANDSSQRTDKANI